jgi:geranylgeranyl diphosphate synthase type II
MEKFLSKQLYSIVENAPDVLRDAMVHAVFSGGGRVRPNLVLHIAKALGAKQDNVTLAAATAVEFIHCASLVHDDMPCFDNADVRRGRPSVHRAFGDRIALLVGDGLIAGAFEVLARNAAHHPNFAAMVKEAARSIGASDGLVSGQAWEDQPGAAVETVHEKKTGALFEAATVMAALVAGTDEQPWRRLGRLIGAAYQVADDLLDAAGSAEAAGKPVHQDARPETASAVKSYGLSLAVSRFNALVEEAVLSIPECREKEKIESLVRTIAARLCPPSLVGEPSDGRTQLEHSVPAHVAQAV